MQKASGIGRLQDASDVNVSLGAGVDGYTLNYDHDTAKFVLVAPVSSGSTSLAGCSDVNVSLGAGVDEYALCYDHDTARFVLRQIAGVYLAATGATVGATSQAQTFTNGVKAGILFPSSDGVSALRLCKADGINGVVTVDTTNSRVGVGVNITPAATLEVNGVSGDAALKIVTPSSGGYKGIQITRTSFGSVGFGYSNGFSFFDSSWANLATFSNCSQTGYINLFAGCDFKFYDSVDSTEIMYLQNAGNVGIGTTAPAVRLDVMVLDSSTSAVLDIFAVRHRSSNTPAVGFGVALVLYLNSSTTADQNACRIYAVWSEATHATRKAQVVFTAYDTSEREAIRIGANGSAATIGFLGATPSARLVHVADASTAHAVTCPSDSPADADALRDDLVTNVIPSVETQLNNLGTKINSILTTLETFGFHATS